MLEILAYAVFLGLALLLALLPKGPSVGRSFFLFWFLSCCALSVAVRVSGFDEDMSIYVEAMQSPGFSLYYLTEPIVWYSLAGLYALVENEYLALTIMDAVGFLLLYRAMKNLECPPYTYFSFFLFFPVVMGFQNIYRQYTATILFLFASSFVSRRRILACAAFLASLLAHNSAAVFLPVFLQQSRIKGVSYLSFGVAVGVIILLPVAAGYKSGASTGTGDFSILYVIVSGLILLLLIVTNKFFVPEHDKWLTSTLALICLLELAATLTLVSGAAERVGLFGLTVSFLLISTVVDQRFRQYRVARLLLLSLSVTPTIAFSSVRQFLL